MMQPRICDVRWYEVEHAQTAIFAVIVDGTRDVNGQEQESICVRYVTDDLFPNEAFLGFFAAESTTGETLWQIVLDVLCRLQLPAENLCGQTFDRASNMSRAYNGAQALIREVQPLAIFVHCSAHCINPFVSVVAIWQRGSLKPLPKRNCAGNFTYLTNIQPLNIEV